MKKFKEFLDSPLAPMVLAALMTACITWGLR